MKPSSFLIVALSLCSLRQAIAGECSPHTLSGTRTVRVRCQSGEISTTGRNQPANCHRAAEAEADAEAERMRLRSLETTCPNLTCTPENILFTRSPYIVFDHLRQAQDTLDTSRCSAHGQYRCECPSSADVDIFEPQDEGGESAPVEATAELAAPQETDASDEIVSEKETSLPVEAPAW